MGEGVHTTGMPPGHPGHGVHALPHGATAPALWMLGSSDHGARLAAQLGVPYAFAYFITDGQGTAEALHLYRSGYRPNALNPQPHALLCVWALAAETEAEAWHLYKSRARMRMDRNLGRLGPLPAPEHAERVWSEAERAALEQLHQGALVGSGPQVADKLRELAAQHAVDELAVITWTHDPAAQLRSYELLAREFALSCEPA